jgi:hypothetical protein
MYLGTLSNYTQTPVQALSFNNGNGSLLGEYEVTNDTVFLYHFNETIGDEPLDSSNYNHSSLRIGTDVDSMQYSDGKYLTPAYDFQENKDHGIQINSTINFSHEFSMDCWFSKSAWTNNNHSETLYGRDDGSIFCGFEYLKTGKREFASFTLFDEFDTGYYLNYEFDFIEGRWYHVVYTYDNDTMRILLDGVEVASNTIGSIDIKNSTSNHTIANINEDEYFDGKVDELRVQDINASTYLQENLFNLHYNDSYYHVFNGTGNYMEINCLYNASLLGESIFYLDSQMIYENPSSIVNITNEQLFAYNYTSSSYIELDYDNHLINATDFIAANGTVDLVINYTANETYFQLNLNELVLNGYWEIGIESMNWSYYSDDTRIVMFQDPLYNVTSFIMEFEIDDPIEEIFNTLTYYELTISEGNFSEDVEFHLAFYNFTDNDWTICDELASIRELNTTNEILFEISEIPMHYYEDIVEDNLEFDRICILFNFSSPSAKVYLDHVHKVIDYMDSTDYVIETYDYKVTFFIEND